MGLDVHVRHPGDVHQLGDVQLHPDGVRDHAALLLERTMDFGDVLVAIGVPMYWVGGLMFIFGGGMLLFNAFIAKNRKETTKKKGILLMLVGGGLCIVATIITAIGGDPFPG